MGTDTSEREQGIDFSDINPILEDLAYPIAAADFIARHGDRAIKRTNADPIAIEEVLPPLEDETFDSAEEIRQSILNFMPREAVGREEYSDRGGELPDERDDTPGGNETL